MKISIIIVNYNTQQLLFECLKSIYNPKLKEMDNLIETIVIDNASSDDSQIMLAKCFPKVKIINNTKNIGFGKANNQGVKIAQGEWVLLLNSDTQFKLDTLKKILLVINQAHWLDVIGCKILNPDGTIQPSAGYFPSLIRITSQMLFWDDLPIVKHYFKPYQQSLRKFYSQFHQVDWVTGAFFLISNKLYQKVKGFDESIFMYGEEVELCYRLKAFGATIKFNPEIEIFHNKGGSSNNGFEAAIIGEYKGLIRIYQKEYPEQLVWCRMILTLGALLRVCLFGMINPTKAVAYKKLLHSI
jgi:GT2 family glycosyltransferase